MTLRTIIISFIFLLSVFGAFCAGYYKGGHDFEYLDHVLIGKISAYEIEHCNTKSEDAASCYKFDADLNISWALFHYLHQKEKILPISKVIFKDYAAMQDAAVNHMLEHVNKYGLNYNCEWVEKTNPNDYTECIAVVKVINAMASEHSNTTLQIAPIGVK